MSLREQLEVEKIADRIYNVGFRNGQIDMQSKVLKKINRDWSLLALKPTALIMQILKSVNKIKPISLSAKPEEK